ncbi:MAG: hypothetical protein QXG03_06625 [Halalkalicoccus sp.]
MIAILVGVILAIPAAHAAWLFWTGSLVGVALFCLGVGVYWIAAERYSPTKRDARNGATHHESDRSTHNGS